MSKIELSEAERSELERCLSRGKANARNMKRAQILLKSADGWSVTRIVETFGTSAATVTNVRSRYRAGGVAEVLQDKVQAKRRRALGEAKRRCWWRSPVAPYQTVMTIGRCRMLRDKLIELEVVERVSAATIQNRLKKMNLSPGNANRGVSPKK